LSPKKFYKIRSINILNNFVILQNGTYSYRTQPKNILFVSSLLVQILQICQFIILDLLLLYMRFYYIFFLLFFSSSAFCQTFHITHYNANNILDEDCISASAFDYDGFFWMINNTKVIRFDGKEFKYFSLLNNNRPLTLLNNKYLKTEDDDI
jgi:hypothetical protein